MVLRVFGYGTFITKFYKQYPVVAEIEGYHRVYHDSDLYGLWYPFVLPRDGSKVRGILMHEPDDSLFEWLDQYEGYPDLYGRIRVGALIHSDEEGILGDAMPGDKVEAWLYVPSARTESLTLDPIFKRMRREHKLLYEQMWSRDMWKEKMARERPDIVEALPALFE